MPWPTCPSVRCTGGGSPSVVVSSTIRIWPAAIGSPNVCARIRDSGRCSRSRAAAGNASRSDRLSGVARIALPQPLERLGQRLLLHGAIGVTGIAREHELIVVALRRQD